MLPMEIAPRIYDVGVTDWTVRDFHGYKTDRGASYNSYLIMDEKICLIDTVKACYAGELLEKISRVVDPAKIDYVVVNHVEPDHAGALPEVLKAAPNAKFIITMQGKNEALRHYGDGFDFMVVKEGDKISLGSRELTFVPLPMLHWPDNMVTYCPQDGILFSNDAFGQHYAASKRFDDEVDEYILFYVKNKDINKGQWKEKKEGLDEIFKAFEGFRKQTDDPDEIHKLALEWYKQFSEANPIYGSKHYSWYDDIKGVYFPDNISGPKFGQYVYDVVHPVTGKVVKAPASGWRYPESSMLELISNGGVHFGKDESVIPNKKTYLVDTQYQSLTSIKFKDGRVASKMIEKLLGDAKYFSNPKDVDLMASIFTALEIGNNDIVLDVFSGSGTTAHTVMKMNAEKGTNIRYIHLQLDEAVKEKDAPYKAGYRTIDEIGRARIEASAKLVQEETGADIDYGYTHYYIKQLEDDSIEKMEEFDPEVYIVNNSINDEIGENIILSTWLCKDGYGFNPDVKEIDLDGYKAYYCGKHLYLIGRQFTKDNVNALIKMYVNDITFNPEHIVLFGYSFEAWTISETIQRNLSILKGSRKDLNVNIDTRY